MFIVATKDGKFYKEGEQFVDEKGQKRGFTWDDIPRKVEITALQLTYPFPVKFKKPDGSVSEEVHPKLTLSKLDRFYFFNEALIPMLVQGEKIIQTGISELQAKTIAGIDDKAGIVIEIRMDKWGNCTVSTFPFKALEQRIKKALFRREIIRNGSR